ncbi:MAG: hypothetical protein ACRCYT_01730 [Cetobacterium sp.]
MLKDCIEIFKRDRENYLSKSETHDEISFITDRYSLSLGSYILVDIDTKKIIKRLEVIKNIKKDEDYEFFASLDYLSKLLSMDKPIDYKKVIHSNNIYSFFLKKESFKEKLTKERVEAYYSILKNPKMKYKNDKKKLEVYNDFENEFGVVSEEKVNTIQEWILENLLESNIFETLEDLKLDKSYLKIFFTANLDEYKKESLRYIIPNIYASSNYTIKVNDLTYGLPNNNLNLNSKKPFLKNLTRKVSTPYLIDTEEVLTQKYFFDYLMTFAENRLNNIYFNFEDGITGYKNLPENLKEGYFLRINKGNELEILDIDLVKRKEKEKKINNLDIFELNYKNSDAKYYYLIKNNIELEILINKIFYENCLSDNYFTNLKDLNLPNLVSITPKLLDESKTIWIELFFKNNDFLLKNNFEKMMIKIIKNTLIKEKSFKASQQFNLYVSVCNYIKNQEENMVNIANDLFQKLNKKINSETTQKIESDEEYFMAIGQLVKYFIFLNKSSNKNHNLINPIINAKSIDKIESELQKLFKKYNYAINSNSKRFNNLYAIVLGYKTCSKVDEKYLMLGYLYNSVIYFKEKV